MSGGILAIWHFLAWTNDLYYSNGTTISGGLKVVEGVTVSQDYRSRAMVLSELQEMSQVLRPCSMCHKRRSQYCRKRSDETFVRKLYYLWLDSLPK